MSREEFDVAIIGGGVVGASLARELTRWRVRVVVLDRAAVGSQPRQQLHDPRRL